MIDLPLARYRLEFEVGTPLHLPDYAGSALRGAFGGALRAACCMTKQPTCEGCALLATCPYAIVFETRPPADGHGLQKFAQVPRPYVIEPPDWGARAYSPGEPLVFHLVLAGRALDQLALVLWAFVKALRRGVGKGDGQARLIRVVHLGMEETTILDGPDGQIAEHHNAVPPAPTFAEKLTLQFETPLRLQANGRRATEEEFTPRRLLMALVRRVALIREFHGDGPWPLDFSDLAHRADTIVGEKNLRWRDWTRYSSRQDREMTLGGVVGEWHLAGDLAAFLPFVHLGQWLHVGKEATFGMGRYRLDIATNPSP